MSQRRPRIGRSLRSVSGTFLLILAAAWLVRCSAAYKDPSTGPGQQSIVDQVNNDLTAGDCGSALALLKPIIGTAASNDTYLMLYSSAYACQGGVSIPGIIGSLNNAGGDIWSTLVAADPSNGADGHLNALNQAVGILFQTATPSGVFNAGARTPDVNIDVILLEAITIATVISPAGKANSVTGQKTQSIATDTSINDECQIEVAFAEITDSLQYVQAGSGLSSLSNSINSECSQVPGGCPTNEDINACLTGPSALVFQTQGEELLIAIDETWQ